MEKEKMYERMQNAYLNKEKDIYWLVNLYNEFSDEFWLCVTFWVDWNEYWWDDSIYCYVYVDNIWSIVFNRACDWYTDPDFYKDAVNYLLYMDEEWKELLKKFD